MKNKFILISCGRCGTGFINSTIGKYFNLNHNCERELLGSCTSKMKKIKNPIKTIDSYYNDILSRYPSDLIYGFKWKPYYTYKNYKQLFAYIKNNNFKIIVNYRNPIDKIISNVKLRQSKKRGIGRAHYKSSNKVVKDIKNEKIIVPTENLIKKIQGIEKTMETYVNLLNEYEINYLEINYEDLSDKNIQKWKKLLKFLFLHPVNINKLKHTLNNPKYVKVVKKSHPEIIENYDKVSEVLKDTPYDKYLTKVVK